jgi:hypothetical protein
MLPDGTGYVDETGVHRGAPPTQEDIKRVSLYMMHRMMFGPYDVVMSQEMPIEEAKKRWPNTQVLGEEK